MSEKFERSGEQAKVTDEFPPAPGIQFVEITLDRYDELLRKESALSMIADLSVIRTQKMLNGDFDLYSSEEYDVLNHFHLLREE